MKERLSAGEIKRCELDILADVARFCEEKDLHYSLTFGTLLGAVRHNGFIPWDDDIDIAMPRDEYEFFICHYTHDTYQAMEARLQPDYPYAFAKVIDTCTELVEEVNSKVPMGVCVDIFPVDGLPEGEEAAPHMKKCQYLSRAAMYKIITLNYPEDFAHKVIHMGIKLLLAVIPLRKIISAQNRLATRYDIRESQYAALLAIRLGCKHKFEKNMFYDLVKHPFEDRAFYIPAAYDRYLTSVYGDYMTPPPENKRNAHFLEAYWK